MKTDEKILETIFSEMEYLAIWFLILSAVIELGFGVYGFLHA